ncbi:MAG: hypothetical protein HQK53_14730 [Oligoflexia bacterium]|nr:hypothetical protein [Oligoflexia bacterium]
MKKCYTFLLLISLLTILLSYPALSYAEFSDDIVLQKNRIAFLVPNISKPKYFGFEIGFITSKKINSINYPFNAFVKAYLAEESYSVQDDLRSSALGVKAGIISPTQSGVPVYVEIAGGFAKTTHQKDPWFGHKHDSFSRKILLLIEGGAMVRVKKNFLVRYTYQYHINNVKYFTRKNFISIGLIF